MNASADMSPAALAAIAQRTFRSGSAGMRAMQQLRPYICPFEVVLQQIPQGARTLDIGCGGGLLGALVCATRSPARFVGFDSSAAAIAVAKENAANTAGSVRPEFHRLDVGAPWPSGPFDVVTMVDVLHHIPPGVQQGAIQAAVAAVQPGGRFIYKDISPRGLVRPWANQFHDLVMARQWVHPAEPASVRQWAERAGGRLLQHSRHNRLWYGHELLVFERVS